MEKFTKNELEAIRCLSVEKRIDIKADTNIPNCFVGINQYTETLETIIGKVRKM